MGTRSTIAIENADGTVTGIYCHWDGYISNNGRILEDYYTDEDKVRELIALGDLSSLGETVGVKVDFDSYDRSKSQCLAYARDRGEKDVEAKTYASHAALIEGMGQEYDYLFTPSRGWRVRYSSGWDNAELPLRAAIDAEAAEPA